MSTKQFRSLAPNQTLFDEYLTLLKNISDDPFLKIISLILQLPSLSDQLESLRTIKTICKNEWFQLFQPRFCYETRLRYFACAVEGQLKFFMFMLECHLRERLAHKSFSFKSLGSCLNYIQTNIGSLASYNNLSSYLNMFNNVCEIRNAVNHNRYVFTFEYDSLTDKATLSSLEEREKSLSIKARSLLIKLKHDKSGKVLNAFEGFGSLMKLKSDVPKNKFINVDKSLFHYQDSKKNNIAPITIKSPRMSISELTILLNNLDVFVDTVMLSSFAEIDRRLHNGKIQENVCKQCKAPSMLLATTRQYRCWHCKKNNTV